MIVNKTVYKSSCHPLMVLVIHRVVTDKYSVCNIILLHVVTVSSVILHEAASGAVFKGELYSV